MSVEKGTTRAATQVYPSPPPSGHPLFSGSNTNTLFCSPNLSTSPVAASHKESFHLLGEVNKNKNIVMFQNWGPWEWDPLGFYTPAWQRVRGKRKAQLGRDPRVPPRLGHVSASSPGALPALPNRSTHTRNTDTARLPGLTLGSAQATLTGCPACQLMGSCYLLHRWQINAFNTQRLISLRWSRASWFAEGGPAQGRV